MRKRGDKERKRFRERLEDKLFDLRMWIPDLAAIDMDFVPYGRRVYLHREKRMRIAKEIRSIRQVLRMTPTV